MQWTLAQRKAALMRFLRSRTPNASGRKPRAQKIPDELRAEITKDSKKVPMLFELWCGHGEDWMRVHVYYRKIRRTTTGTEVTQAWKTRAQLLKLYGGDKEVVVGIIGSRDPATQVRDPPDAPTLASAKQYLVTVFDAESKKDENIDETGLAGDGMLDDREAAKKIAEGLMSGGPTCTFQTNPKLKSKEEKQQEKDDREAKKTALKKDPSAHAKMWPAGMSKDVGKAIDALSQCKKSKDKTVGPSYTQTFTNHVVTLKKLRSRIENPGKEPIIKKDMINAEDCVKELKDDLSAWNRIKPIYVKDRGLSRALNVPPGP